MKRFLTFLLSCQLFQFQGAAAVTVEMGKILMNLNSQTLGNNDHHLFEDVLSITSKFLNDYFRAFYEIDNTYFNSVTLRLRPFNIQMESDNTRTAQLEFAGILSFSVQPVPTTTQVDNLIENAFSGRNLGKFLQAFLRSNNDFLKNLQNFEVLVSDNLITHDLNTEEVSDENDKNDGKLFTGWMAIMVYGVAIVAGILLAIAMVFLCRCCCRSKSRKKADHRRLKPVGSSDEDNQKNQKQKRKEKDNKTRKEEKQELHDSMFSDRPPSPDKSEYSYNQNDVSMLSTDTGAMSLMSKASMGLSNYNQATEASYSMDPSGRKNWRRSGTSIPYGQDVSLLDDFQLNVLGQIEEDEESRYSMSSRSSSTGEKAQEKDSVLQIRKQKKKAKPQSKLRQPSTSSMFGSKKDKYNGVPNGNYLTESLTDSTTSPSSSGSGGFGADVIDDLADLSFQIKASRGRNPQHI